VPFDWQFVVVTLVALAAAGVIVWRFVPAPRSSRSGRKVDSACAHCASRGDTARPPHAARTETTPVVLLRQLRK
jgi:hypothetical protein